MEEVDARNMNIVGFLVKTLIATIYQMYNIRLPSEKKMGCVFGFFYVDLIDELEVIIAYILYRLFGSSHLQL